MSFCRASTAFRLPMIGKNSTRAACAMLLIPHKFLVEFLQSIHSLSAAHAEQKLGSSLKLGQEAWESWGDAVRQL